MTTQNNPASTATHTAGPWEFSRMLHGTSVDKRSGFVVNGPEADPLPVRICDIRCTPDIPFATAEANARLIAAAPELLDALQAIESRLTKAANAFYVGGKASELRAAFDGWKSDIEPARAALARATQSPL